MEIRKKRSTTKKDDSRSTLIHKLDKVFAHYIRLRDTMPSGFFVCISCGQIKPFEQSDCGHFFSRTHLITRFDEDNCHGECRHCNRFASDHLVGYQKNLIRKIGDTRYKMLELKVHDKELNKEFLKKLSNNELELKIRYYKQEVFRLSRDKGIKISK